MIPWETRPLPGTELEVRPISYEAMVAFNKARESKGIDELQVQLVALSLFKPGAESPAFTEAEVRALPFPVVRAAGDLATKVNGLVADDPIGEAAGN